MVALFRRLFSLQLVRFGTVGVTVTGCFMGLNALFARGFGWPPQLAFLVAYPPSLCLHFLLNKLWTFGDRRSTSGRHVGEYLFTAVLTFMIQWPAFTLLQDVLRLPGWLAAGGANVMQVAVSFLLLRRRVFDQGGESPADATRAAWHRLVLLLATVATAALLGWTHLGGWEPPAIGPVQSDYYNLLASGFKKGSLALDLEVPEVLRQAENPWDPAQRPPGVGMHDASYYHGHFYIYYGVVPVAVVFFPFLVVTGHALPFALGSLGFSLGAFLLAAWLWTRVIRDAFPRASLVTKLVGVVGLGTVGGQLVLARRVSLWEGPIAAGHFFMMGFLAAAYLALRSRRPAPWLAAGGLALGLAVGSRPSLIAASFSLGWVVWGRGPAAPRAGPAPRGPGAALPGRRGGVRRDHRPAPGLQLRALRQRLRVWHQVPADRRGRIQGASLQPLVRDVQPGHLLPACAAVGAVFSLPASVAEVAAPAGYYGIEYVYGLFWVCPLIFWAAVSGRFLGRSDAAGELKRFAGFLAVLALGMTGFMLTNYTAAARYLVDFLPWWLWLACLGWAYLEDTLRVHSLLRLGGWLRTAFGLSAAFTFVLAFCASAELHGLLQHDNPGAYRVVSRVFDLPVGWAERLLGQRSGPLECDVTFAAASAGPLAPLIVTGVGYQKDFIYLVYTSDRLVQIGSASTSQAGALSAPFAVEPGHTYHLRVASGALYPPVGHPDYTGWAPAEVDSVKHWVKIDWDGRTVLNDLSPSHEASPGTLRLGRDVPHGPYGERFAGTLSHVRRMGVRRSAAAASAPDAVWLDLTLPTAVEPGNQPLLEAGRPGAADIVALHRLDPRRVEFTYESWSHGLWHSDPVEIPADRALALQLSLGSLGAEGNDAAWHIRRQALVIYAGGRPVWWKKLAFPIETSPRRFIGENALGSSAATAAFSGLLRVGAPGPEAAWASAPAAGVLALELGGRGTGLEPLVTAGSPAGGDALGVEWLKPDQARLVYRHASAAPAGDVTLQSDRFTWSSSAIHRLRVQVPGPAAGRLRVTFDGQPVWEVSAPASPAANPAWAVGRNLVGWKDCAAELSAVVISGEGTLGGQP